MNSKIKDISTNASLVMKIINANLTPPKKQPFKVKEAPFSFEQVPLNDKQKI